MLRCGREEDDNEEEDVEEVDEGGEGQNCAFLTLEMLASTPRGVTFPMTVTFFAWKSMSKDFTPANQKWIE